jgi:uncharacterized damage-inducible protein DinB
MNLIGSIIGNFIRRSARKHSVEEWQAKLVESEALVFGRIETSQNSEKNQTLSRHVIGIERWAQSRLNVFLGANLQRGEYDAYQPAAGTDVAALSQAFQDTRQATVALVKQIQQAGVGDTQTVLHNQLGEFTVRDWLVYIDGHATRESGRLK